MAVRLRDMLMRELETLRYEPIDKRIRATIGDQTLVDSTRALLVWEPKRVVPTYAVPIGDVAAEITADPAAAPAAMEPPVGELRDGKMLDGRPVYDPSIPFTVHTAEGEPVRIRTDAGREVAGFRPSAPELDGYVLVDFDGLDAWWEEEERNLAHPRDPFHRIDIVRSARHVRVELDGTLLAESSTPYLLFEPPLPVRYYLPREDVEMSLLEPSSKRTFCAYKGEALYFSAPGAQDVAWSYEHPLREAAIVSGRIAFFNERVDLRVDGAPLERPLTPWSPR